MYSEIFRICSLIKKLHYTDAYFSKFEKNRWLLFTLKTFLCKILLRSKKFFIERWCAMELKFHLKHIRVTAFAWQNHTINFKCLFETCMKYLSRLNMIYIRFLTCIVQEQSCARFFFFHLVYQLSFVELTKFSSIKIISYASLRFTF